MRERESERERERERERRVIETNVDHARAFCESSFRLGGGFDTEFRFLSFFFFFSVFVTETKFSRSTKICFAPEFEI